MCVIIIREPGVTIPPEKIETACRVNKHGFGIAYVHRRRLKFIRSIETNDPAVVNKHLNDLKDVRVFLHLRHATVGKVSMINNHPFSVLEYKESAVDMAFMHNGTLGGWTPTGDAGEISDSRNFMESLVRPLSLRSRSFFGTKTLSDPFFIQQIRREVGNYSVLVFFDSLGGIRIFNKEQGEQFEGWWASNKYSFNNNHSRAGGRAWEWPDDDQRPYRYRSQESQRLHGLRDINYEPKIALKDAVSSATSGFVPWKLEWEEALEEYDKTNKETSYNTMLEKAGKYSWQDYRHQMNTVQQYITTAMIETPENAMAEQVNQPKTQIKQLNVSRPSFVQEMEMSDITDMCLLTIEHFVVLSQKCPHAMAEAWVELNGVVAKLRAENKILKSSKEKPNV